MQNMRHKKLAAMLLTLVMALSLLTVTAFAEDQDVASIGDKTYPSLQAAVDAADKGDVIKLLGNFTGDGVVVESGKEIIIDFGGYTYDIDKTVIFLIISV